MKAGARLSYTQTEMKIRVPVKNGSIILDDDPPPAARYRELFEITGWNETYRAGEKELAAALKRSFCALSAYDGEKLVGFGRVVSDGILYAVIYDIIVAPSHRERGIGGVILAGLVERCRAAGIRDIQLFAAKGRADYYRKRGFLERDPDAPGMRWRGDNTTK